MGNRKSAHDNSFVHIHKTACAYINEEYGIARTIERKESDINVERVFDCVANVVKLDKQEFD
jgi:hypothetical protein